MTSLSATFIWQPFVSMNSFLFSTFFYFVKFMQRYEQTSKKYEVCFNIFYSKCSVSSRFASKTRTNVRKNQP